MDEGELLYTVGGSVGWESFRSPCVFIFISDSCPQREKVQQSTSEGDIYLKKERVNTHSHLSVDHPAWRDPHGCAQESLRKSRVAAARKGSLSKVLNPRVEEVSLPLKR